MSHPSAFRQNWLYERSIEFLEGKGVAKNLEKAFSLNEEAAEMGHHDAVLAMGWFYLNGKGVAVDREKSWHWYRKSARHGEPKAMFSLGYICYVDRNYDEARQWFTRASKSGHKRSLYWLGKLHWKGYGIDRDTKQALSLFEQAANAKIHEAKRVLQFLSRRKA
jgi:TPR repeat protein